MLVPQLMFLEQNISWVNAMKRSAAELGIERSLTHYLIQGTGGIKYKKGGQFAASMKFQEDDSSNAAFFTPGDLALASASETIKDADIDWSYIQATFGVENSDNAKTANHMVSGDQSLLEKRMKDAMMGIVHKLDDVFMNGLGTGNEAKGLPYWVSQTTNIGLQNLSMVANPWLQSTFRDAIGAALSDSMIRELKAALYDVQGINMRNMIAVTGSIQEQKYQQLLDDRMRYETRQIGDIQFEGYTIDRAPLIAIPSFPNDKIYFLHLPDWEVCVLTQEVNMFKESPCPMLKETGVEGYVMGLKPLAINSDAQNYQLTLYPQLVCHKPWNQALINNLSITL